jgi:2-hydroxy-4-carboxymuconate semialdehyde hemiacetal dehydrogenase
VANYTRAAVKVGLVGYGSIAQAHVKALRALDVDLVGVMGRLPEATEAFAREHALGLATTELDDLLAADLDAVVICSPTDAHADQTERSLRAGKHVLCEIPLATSLSDVDALSALADARDRRLMVCHTQRYYPALREVQARVVGGTLHPHAVICRYGFLRRENVNWMGRRRSWTDNLIWHHGCHAVDTVLWLLGRSAADVTAQVPRPGRLGIPMDLAIGMRTDADQVVTVAMSYNTHLPLHDYVVIGEEETLIVEGQSGLDSIEQQDGDFLAAVRDGTEPPISGRAVRPAMAALQRVQDRLDERVRAL